MEAPKRISSEEANCLVALAMDNSRLANVAESGLRELTTNKKKDDTRAKELHQKVEKLRQEIKKSQRKLEDDTRALRRSIVADAEVVCCTLNGSGIEVLTEVNFDYIIVDEAAQCVEPELLVALQYKAERKIVLVGDHLQLQATVLSHAAARAGFDRSLFSRLQPYLELNGCVRMLDTQYRMHPSICDFPNTRFYKSALKTGKSVTNRDRPQWQQAGIGSASVQYLIDPYLVFDVANGYEQGKPGGSDGYTNTVEADLVVKIINDLRTGYPIVDFTGRFAVITPCVFFFLIEG